MARQNAMVTLYALAHLLVDFACAFLVFRQGADADTRYIGFLLYNACAFALQMPLGLLADRLNKNALCAALGCVLVAAAYGFAGVPFAAAVIAGLGNGLFHIGGGIDVLNAAGGKAGALGVFVSPGALGIFLGKLLVRQSGVAGSVIVMLLLLAAAGAILALRYRKDRGFAADNAPVSFDHALSPVVLAAGLCLFLVVCLRSYTGMTLAFPWKGDGYWGYALVLSVFLGKAAGGFLADRYGAVRTAAVTLALASVLFLLPGVPLAGVTAVFLFNMTMPITLWGVVRLFPGAKGFAFGLLTFGLFLGFVPVWLGYSQLLNLGPGFATAAAGSLLLLAAGLKLSDRVRGEL